MSDWTKIAVTLLGLSVGILAIGELGLAFRVERLEREVEYVGTVAHPKDEVRLDYALQVPEAVLIGSNEAMRVLWAKPRPDISRTVSNEHRVMSANVGTAEVAMVGVSKVEAAIRQYEEARARADKVVEEVRVRAANPEELWRADIAARASEMKIRMPDGKYRKPETDEEKSALEVAACWVMWDELFAYAATNKGGVRLAGPRAESNGCWVFPAGAGMSEWRRASDFNSGRGKTSVWPTAVKGGCK